MSERWELVLACDMDKWAIETFRANFPGVYTAHAKVSDILHTLHEGMASVVIGGCPCQDFSIAGEGAGESGERNAWPDMIAAIEKIKPRMFLCENVPGMLTERHRPYTSRVVAALEALGYRVDVRKLDAVAYGVPQFRKRVWFWGIRHDVDAAHCWPEPTHAWPWPKPSLFGETLLPAVTVGQALGLTDVTYQGHGARQPGPVDPNAPGPTMRHCVPGCSDIQVRAIRRIRGQSQDRPDHDIAEPCPTVMAPTGGKAGLCKVMGGNGNMRYQAHGNRAAGNVGVDAPGPSMRQCVPGCSDIQIYHDGADNPCNTVRRLTPAECARLQSCPDDMAWPEGITKTAQYRIIGNGWACGMAHAMSKALADADPESRTVASLFCGGGLGDLGWHGRYWKWQP